MYFLVGVGGVSVDCSGSRLAAKRPIGGSTLAGGMGGGDDLQIGMKVEVRYRGKSRYYPGRIAYIHRDGSCDIDYYDDGETEQRVDPCLIQPLEPARGGGGGGMGSPSRSGGGGGGGELEVGFKVEARYKGKSRFYPGRIKRKYMNGTYDIDYDDGEKEMGVPLELIQSLEPAGWRRWHGRRRHGWRRRFANRHES